MTYLITFVVALFTTVSSAVAQSDSDCRLITDNTARLACYDTRYGSPVREPAGPPTDQQAPSALERREQSEIELQRNWFALTPYRPNYILPVTYLDHEDFSPYASIGDTGKIKDVEAKYQLSVRTLLWPKMFHSNVDAWFAFTLQSYWQVYASDISAPFRETNYEPEFFASTPLQVDLLGWRLHRCTASTPAWSINRTGAASHSPAAGTGSSDNSPPSVATPHSTQESGGASRKATRTTTTRTSSATWARARSAAPTTGATRRWP